MITRYFFRSSRLSCEAATQLAGCAGFAGFRPNLSLGLLMNLPAFRLTALFFCLLVNVYCSVPVLATGAGSYRDIKMAPDRDTAAEARGELRTDAQEASRLLRVEAMVEKLRAAKQAGISDSTQLPRTIQQARLLCLLKIFIAMEEVRNVIAVINRELSVSYTALDSLTTKRDMAMNMLNTTIFMQAGILGCISQGVNFKYGQPITSKTIATVNFSNITGLSTLGLLVPSIWSRRIDSPPNFLAHVFNESYRPGDAEKSYLWKFMSSPIPGSSDGLTRREILIRHWHDFAGLDSQQEGQVKRLAAMPAADERLRESIRLLSQRITLLHDLKTHLEEFDGSLFELHNAITMN